MVHFNQRERPHQTTSSRTPEPILEVQFFQTAAGNEPVRDWLKARHKEDRRSIGEDIKTAQFGWPLGMPLVLKLEKNLWEVRTDITDGIARTIFTVMGKQMILLHAFVKNRKKPRNPNWKRHANA